MKIAAVLWYLLEVWLSHKPGEQSGRDSKWLAQTTGIKEKLLRRFAHVFLFLVLVLLSAEGFGLWGVLGAAVWAVADEATKPLMSGRHCTGVNMLLNLAGGVTGFVIWLMV